MDIYERIRNRTKPETLKRVETLMRAMTFASSYHKDQMYGDVLFTEHLHEVHEVAYRFELNDDIRIAAWLHDILEDTECTFEEIWDEFGWYVAYLVFLVTDESGINRKERKEKTYPKVASNPDAILLKLCDRIANVESSLENNKGLFQMYKKEHQEFLEGLQISGTQYGKLGEMLGYLDSLFDEK